MFEEDTRDAAKGLRYLSLSEEEREHNKTEICRHRKPSMVDTQVMMKCDYDVQLEDDPVKQLAATADAMVSTRYQEMIRQSRRTTQNLVTPSLPFTQKGYYSHCRDSEMQYRTFIDSLWSMCASHTSKKLDKVKVDCFPAEFANCLANLKQGISVGMLTGLDSIPCILRLTTTTTTTLSSTIGNNKEENAKHKQLMLTVSSTGGDLPGIDESAFPVLFEFPGRCLSCIQILERPQRSFLLEIKDDDDLIGPLIAGSDSDLVTLVFGLASVSSAMARSRNSFLSVLDDDNEYADLLWQGARVCMWHLSHEIGCRAAVEAVENCMCILCKTYNIKKPNLRLCCTSGTSSSVMSE